MTQRLATYTAAFVGAFMVWMVLTLLQNMFPFLPRHYPALALILGLDFPGGAPLYLHYQNHIAETWFPVLVAFVIARTLTKGRARLWGSLVLYAVFLLWSSLLLQWADSGASPHTVFCIGLAGAFFGGAFLYLWLVDPQTATDGAGKNT